MCYLPSIKITSSRLHDNRHHPEDSMAGAVIGMLIAGVIFYAQNKENYEFYNYKVDHMT